MQGLVIRSGLHLGVPSSKPLGHFVATDREGNPDHERELDSWLSKDMPPWLWLLACKRNPGLEAQRHEKGDNPLPGRDLIARDRGAAALPVRQSVASQASAEVGSLGDATRESREKSFVKKVLSESLPTLHEVVAHQSAATLPGKIEPTSALVEAAYSNPLDAGPTREVAESTSPRPASPGSDLIVPAETLVPVPARELCRVIASDNNPEQVPTKTVFIPVNPAESLQAAARDKPSAASLLAEGEEKPAEEQVELCVSANDEGSREPEKKGLPGESIPAVEQAGENLQVVAAEETPSSHRQQTEDQLPAAKESGPEKPVFEFDRRPIHSLTVNIKAKPGEMPSDLGKNSLVQIAMKPADAVLLRHWPLMSCEWEAPALAYRPLYFEEVNLERYGYGMKYLRAAQPIVSAGQFFTTIPILPYKMLAEPARTPVYALGHYRPGSDAPYRPVYPPLSVSGSAAEAGVATGLIFVIP
jgi:hypothetical protein